MPYFPYSADLQRAAGVDKNFDRFKHGNFGLWFNKFVPLANQQEPKASNNTGSTTDVVEYYKEQFRTNVTELLVNKHLNQIGFCKAMEQLGYTLIVFHAKLKTPLITGIGESHPHEIGMVFDHTMGIPYIPASGIKGVSRLHFILNHIEQNMPDGDSVDVESIDGFVDAFGAQEKRGNVVFLDAYSTKTPKLKVDVMTPHYGDYYKEGSEIPPADNQNPNPIKFLTVQEGTEFIFRMVVKDAKIDTVTAAVKKMFENGIGAKTALGYGAFTVLTLNNDPFEQELQRKEEQKQREQEEARRKAEEEAQRQKIEKMSPHERLLYQIGRLDNDTGKIAELTVDLLNGDYSRDVFIAFKEKLQQLGQWKPSGSRQRKNKLKQRNDEINRRIESGS